MHWTLLTLCGLLVLKTNTSTECGCKCKSFQSSQRIYTIEMTWIKLVLCSTKERIQISNALNWILYKIYCQFATVVECYSLLLQRSQKWTKSILIYYIWLAMYIHMISKKLLRNCQWIRILLKISLMVFSMGCNNNRFIPCEILSYIACLLFFCCDMKWARARFCVWLIRYAIQLAHSMLSWIHEWILSHTFR